jgi:hypothetical protein
VRAAILASQATLKKHERELENIMKKKKKAQKEDSKAQKEDSTPVTISSGDSSVSLICIWFHLFELNILQEIDL